MLAGEITDAEKVRLAGKIMDVVANAADLFQMTTGIIISIRKILRRE